MPNEIGSKIGSRTLFVWGEHLIRSQKVCDMLGMIRDVILQFRCSFRQQFGIEIGMRTSVYEGNVGQKLLIRSQMVR